MIDSDKVNGRFIRDWLGHGQHSEAQQLSPVPAAGERAAAAAMIPASYRARKLMTFS